MCVGLNFEHGWADAHHLGSKCTRMKDGERKREKQGEKERERQKDGERKRERETHRGEEGKRETETWKERQIMDCKRGGRERWRGGVMEGEWREGREGEG